MIVTLTMNPSVDRSVATARVAADDKLRCTPLRLDAGGGGINVSRALRELGGDSVAVHPVGGATGELLRALLDQEGIAHRAVPIAGETRENLTVAEEATGDRYRFVLPGPALAAGEWARCLDELDAVRPAPRYVVASGSLPPGVPTDFYARLVERARARGARVVLDTSGPPLAAALEAGVHLVKPNRRELGALLGAEPSTDDAERRAAGELVARRGAEVVVLSLGSRGAVVASEGGVEHVAAPAVEARSAVGAGDSTVAGVVLGLVRGDPLPHAVRRGIAAGAAAAMTPGTELCRRADAERLYALLLDRDAP